MHIHMKFFLNRNFFNEYNNIFTRKHQVILPVTSKMKVACVKEIIEQKKNLLLIQNAYINEVS